MEHEGPVYSAQFSPDGQRVVTASRDRTARLWDIPIFNDPTPGISLGDLAAAIGGVSLQTVGQEENFKVLTTEQTKLIRKFAAEYGKYAESPLQRWLKWNVSERRTRTISPFSQLIVPEWVENKIKEGTVEGLRGAMQLDPTNARITAHLGRRLADQALEQGSDPDEARRARGEADFLTSRARKLAPDSEQVKKLRTEVVKLLELKPN